MSSGFLPFDLPTDEASGPEWRRQFEEWRQQIAECERKPSRGRVHALRVATLRLQAQLEYWLPPGKPGDPATRAARRWDRQARKLRRALSPVRAADVYVEKLARLRESAAEGTEGQPQCSRSCLRQIGKLEERFARQRQQAARRLRTEFEVRRERLIRLSRDLEAALEAPGLRDARHGAVALKDMISRLRVEFPELNGETLHAFRKRVKAARYLAEVTAETDPVAQRQAATLSRMQAAAGEWHDWDVLAQKAARTRRKRESKGGAAELLETLATKSLKRALNECARLTTRLMRHGTEHGAPSAPLPQKLPVGSVRPQAARAEKKSA